MPTREEFWTKCRHDTSFTQCQLSAPTALVACEVGGIQTTVLHDSSHANDMIPFLGDDFSSFVEREADHREEFRVQLRLSPAYKVSSLVFVLALISLPP